MFGLWSFNEPSKFPRLSKLDFIWSVENAMEVQAYRKTMGPRAILSKYLAFTLNSMPASINGSLVSSNLTWWQQHHPSWVVYKCDRKTPATYWGNGIPLDISNPEVLQWQLHAPAYKNPHSVDALVAAGFDAISLDVFGWGNYGHACGVYDKAGKWRQLYNGTKWVEPAYWWACHKWLKEFYAGIAGRLFLVPNYSSNPGCQPTCPTCLPSCDAWNGSNAFYVGNHSDGELSEAGFTSFGSNVTTGTDWENRLEHMRTQQLAGRFYFDVSYWGPVNVRTKAAAAITPAVLDYIIGSWMVGNEGLSAVFLAPNDCPRPCKFDTWKGNMLNYSQFFAPIGYPLGPATRGHLGCAGVWSRNYSGAVVYVNPQPVLDSQHARSGSSADACAVHLEAGWRYTRLDLSPIHTLTLPLPNASAVVLLRTVETDHTHTQGLR